MYSVTDTGVVGEKKGSAPNRNGTDDLPISASDALPLNYRRLMAGWVI